MKITDITEGINGLVSFVCFDMVGQKNTPTIKVVCTDEDGRTARGDIWCSLKNLDRACETLKALGVPGRDNREIIANVEAHLQDVECTFDTEESRDGQYINAVSIRARGDDKPTGGFGVSHDAFTAAIFGAAPVPSSSNKETKAASDDFPY